jgi:hypothetical protein
LPLQAGRSDYQWTLQRPHSLEQLKMRIAEAFQDQKNQEERLKLEQISESLTLRLTGQPRSNSESEWFRNVFQTNVRSFIVTLLKLIENKDRTPNIPLLKFRNLEAIDIIAGYLVHLTLENKEMFETLDIDEVVSENVFELATFCSENRRILDTIVGRAKTSEIAVRSGKWDILLAAFYYKIRHHWAHFSGHEEQLLSSTLAFFAVNSIGIKSCIFVYLYFRSSKISGTFRSYMLTHMHIQQTCKMRNDLNSESGHICHTIWTYLGFTIEIHSKITKVKWI